jgi:hypothetical protein
MARKLTRRKRKGKGKTKGIRNRIRKGIRNKKLVGGSFTEASSMLSHFFNKGLNTFLIPSPTTVSGDPRITNQFI